MEVKTGHNHIKEKTIPKEWQKSSLGMLFTFSRGVTASRDRLSEEGLCYLHYGDIHGATKTFIDVSEEYSKIPKLQIPLSVINKKSLLHDGDVVFVDASEDDEGTSKYVVVHNSKGIPYISGLHTIVAKSVDDSLDNVYKRYCFQADYVKKQFVCYAVGTKVSGVSKKNIAKIEVLYPCSKTEQGNIAATLSDIDALISSLERLIAKKRDIEQGAMQLLLTGKKRLPGFNDKWGFKLLEGLFVFSGGLSASREQLSDNGLCYLHYGDIHGAKKSFIDVSVEYMFIPKLRIKLDSVPQKSLLKDGDVVFVDASEDDEGASRHVVVRNPNNIPYISGLHTIVAKSINKLLDWKYKQYCFQTDDVKRQFTHFSVGTKVTGISKKNIAKIKIPVPTLPEQIAIAQILDTLDTELTQLEQQLTKYKMIKQGMMQQLLTGKIRLI